MFLVISYEVTGSENSFVIDSLIIPQNRLSIWYAQVWEKDLFMTVLYFMSRYMCVFDYLWNRYRCCWRHDGAGWQSCRLLGYSPFILQTWRRGDQIWTQNGSDWPQMGQIRDFFRSDFSTFWRKVKSQYLHLKSGAAKCTKIWSE